MLNTRARSRTDCPIVKPYPGPRHPPRHMYISAAANIVRKRRHLYHPLLFIAAPAPEMARSCRPLVLRVVTRGRPLVVWAPGPMLARLLAVEIVGLLKLCTLDNLLGAGALLGLGSRVLVPAVRSAVTGGSGSGRWLP
jgi:hypothetical protein